MASVLGMKPFFEPLIRRWPTVTSFADEVGCDEKVARQWIHNDSIPAAWFAPVRRAAVKRGMHDITTDSLSAIAERRRLAKEADRRSEAA